MYFLKTESVPGLVSAAQLTIFKAITTRKMCGQDKTWVACGEGGGGCFAGQWRCREVDSAHLHKPTRYKWVQLNTEVGIYYSHSSDLGNRKSTLKPQQPQPQVLFTGACSYSIPP